jgi:hypothetical protein
MSGERMSSRPLADKRPKLADKYREGFHPENILGIGRW